MKNRKYLPMWVKLLPLAVGMLIPSLSFAAAITGTLVLSGHGTEVIAVNGTMIDFDFSGTVSNTFPPIATSGTIDGNGDTALFDIAAASTGSFSGAMIGTTVTVHDLDSSQEPVGTTVGGILPLNNFITFASKPLWSLSMTELLPGVFTSAACTSGTPSAGQTCTPVGSPFNLTNLAGNQVNVSFAFMGLANDGQGNITGISGTFGTTFSNTNLEAIYSDIAAGQTIVTSGSATIAATTIPEPGSTSTMLLGSGLIVSSLIYRRRRQRG